MHLSIPIVLATLLPSCSSPTVAPASSPPSAASASSGFIDGATAHALVRNGATLVDVRNTDEYSSGHIEGAINVPASEVASHDFGGKDKPLVLYCAHGHRSQQAGDALRGQGYTHVQVLGPMSAWGQ